MKITFVLPRAGMAGGIRVVAIYADRLQKRGHEVFVISQPTRKLTWEEQVRSLLKGQGWKSSSINSPSHFDGLDIPHRILGQNRPVVDDDLPDADVVIATWWKTAEWVNQLSSQKGAKAYFIQHHEIHDYYPEDRVKATWRLPMHKIVISRWLQDLSSQEYGDSFVSLVPNSVDTQQFYASPRGKQTVPCVGLLYSTIPWKGCDVSFRAIALARQAFPDLRLVAFGAKPVAPSLPLPPNSTYTQLPPQDSIKDLYAQCDVWLCGSYTEGFHLPPLEAMACRCPVVSTQVGGPMDVVEEGINGYLSPVGDTESLANGLKKVLSLSDVEWKAMSDGAYLTATRYTWDDATDLFEAALRDAIEKNCG